MSAPLPKAPTLVMLAGVCAGVLLHIDRAPLWCVGVALAAVLWHWLHCIGRLRLPPAALRLLLTLALFGGIAASFRTLSGLAAGSALLLVMGAAKLLETRTRRDALVVTLVALVLVLAACLDRQSLLRVPLYLAAAWTALAGIAAMGGAREGAAPLRAFGTAGRALLLAVPLALLCFLLVPRLSGALWSVPGGQAQTGLSDEMSPGSISELSINDDIAFRVRFEGSAPPPAQRYWRGPVLHEFDGYTWRRQPGQVALQEQLALSPSPLRYRVMLEPTGRPYLFGIDTIESIVGVRNFRNFDGQVQAYRPVTAALAYSGVSHLTTRYHGPLSLTGRRLDTRLPANRNPRTVALALQLRAQGGSDEQYSRRVLDYFRAAGFEYTLTPPLLDRNSVDDLIFNTRRGFCGHFASAYVMLMRAAGVPARVVTGYLGGSWNPVGGYYAVRQSQAHAWAEIWLDGAGWTRVDPTAVVAPERLQQEGSELLRLREGGMDSLFGDPAWLRNLRDSWDAANNWWQERVVNFNRDAQLDLLRRLGLDDIDYRGMALLLGAGGALWGVLLWWTGRTPRAVRADELERVWTRFATVLATRGVSIATHEGSRSVAARAARSLPTAAADIGSFVARYEQLRFGSAICEQSDLSALRGLLRRIARATAAVRRPRTAPAAPG